MRAKRSRQREAENASESKGDVLEGFIPLEDSDPDDGDSSRQHEQHPPWFNKKSWCPDNVLVTLHNEILDFCSLVLPTPEEKEAYNSALLYLKKVSQEVLGDKPLVEVFGSHLTQLLLPSSDLDVTILRAPDTAYRAMVSELRRRANMGEVESLEVVDTARVPIIKFVHVVSGLNCDICFNQYGGINTGRKTMELLSEHSVARPLVLVSTKVTLPSPLATGI